MAGPIEDEGADEAPRDPVHQMILRRAELCLAHSRAVVWGEGTADFQVWDGEYGRAVRISVRAVEKKPARGKPPEEIRNG